MMEKKDAKQENKKNNQNSKKNRTVVIKTLWIG